MNIIVMMDFKYSVPIIPQNLNKHETIVQIAEVLNHLSNITDSIFNQVNNKIENSRTKLTNISNRVDVVSEKINQLRGAKKATQVFSSSKYPASEICREYSSIFHDSESITLERRKVKSKNAYSSYEPLDKLQFYHVNISMNDKSHKFKDTDDIINNTEFVNDLFCTGRNMSNNVSLSIENKGFSNIAEENSIFSELGEAPSSISKRSTLTLPQNYFYAPKIGEVPALDVPLDLPDLPGIANDLYYNNESGPVIAPSAIITTCLIEDIDLPNVPESEPNEDIPVLNIAPTITITDLPKPPPLEDVLKPQENHNIPEVMQVNVKASEVDSPQLPKVSTSASPKTELPLISDARSSLMEAIRNAGGAKKAMLRSVQSEKKDSSAHKEGDFMADLHSKLSMRRKGISGAKKDIDAESTLGKISAMIPPPEKKHEIESTSNDEEDWD